MKKVSEDAVEEEIDNLFGKKKKANDQSQESGSPSGYTAIDIQHNQMEFASSRSWLPEENIDKSRWIHIAIAYTNGKLKAYMDETRLLNLPRIDFDPKGLTFYTYHARNDNLYYIKNIRIAKGGVKYYDRIMEDGKIIANGIRFDVNKATLKPESMGIINEIADLLKKYPDLKFSVEGHTDSDGEEAFNQTLSEKRAKSVVEKLISMGIDPGRLISRAGEKHNHLLQTVRRKEKRRIGESNLLKFNLFNNGSFRS